MKFLNDHFERLQVKALGNGLFGNGDIEGFEKLFGEIIEGWVRVLGVGEAGGLKPLFRSKLSFSLNKLCRLRGCFQLGTENVLR